MPAQMHSQILHEPGDQVFVDRFTVWCNFKSSTSIGFDLALAGDFHKLIGSLDLHYPCQNEVCPAQIRLTLPEQFASSVESIVSDLFAAMSIPPTTWYQAAFTAPSYSVLYMNRPDVLFGLPVTRIASPDDMGVYLSLLGDNQPTAAIGY